MPATAIPKNSRQFVSSVPTDPIARKQWIQKELQRIRTEQGPKNYNAVIGQWPGDETDEEIVALLKE
ncbi:MAG: hypothetical protein LBQ50_05795 [Planctomycetaceae bacterium]|nr:hypothetical protein [Planctomycetaceae bacterium]